MDKNNKNDKNDKNDIFVNDNNVNDPHTLPQQSSRLNTADSKKSNNSKLSKFGTPQKNNPYPPLHKSAPVRNKIGTYFGNEMANFDIFKFLPSNSTIPLVLIIEAKTPAQWKPGKKYIYYYYY